jgi:transcriptional regulator with XRE-family HTH domain
MTFGEVVCEARSGAGWSLRDLSAALAESGVSVSHVHLWEIERGTRGASAGLARALSKLLMLDRRYLIECIPPRRAEIRVTRRAAR